MHIHTCALSSLGISLAMFLKVWHNYLHFLLWFMFATKILKVSWQENTVNCLLKVSGYCYCVIATVYEINFICRTLHLNLMVDC